MNDLPDDTNLWPRDCFQLLGVPRSASDKELRRSYFRLIKRFKPDTHPQEFQRIHESYEMARQIQERAQSANESEQFWDHPNPVSTPASNDVLDGETLTATPSDSPGLTPTSPTPNEVSPEHVDQFWRLASQGMLDEAVSVLPDIDSQRDRDLAGFAEYFLRRVSAERHDIANAEKRIRLLLQYLDHTHLGPNANFYLINEFQCKPELAMLDCVEEFIRDPSSASQAHALASARWNAIGQDHPKLVVADMSALRNGVSTNLEHLATDAIEYTVWHRFGEFASHNESCKQILNETRSEFLDVVDLLNLAAGELVNGATAWKPNDVGDLIPKARTGFDSNMPKVWLPMAETIDANRSQSLLALGSLAKTKTASMSLFAAGLQRLSMLTDDLGGGITPSANQTKLEVANFLRRNSLQNYDDKTRLSILEFCIGHHVAPRMFGAVADGFVRGNQSVQWSQILRRDIALNCIYHAGVTRQA